jgi:hypothetical protein
MVGLHDQCRRDVVAVRAKIGDDVTGAGAEAWIQVAVAEVASDQDPRQPAQKAADVAGDDCTAAPSGDCRSSTGRTTTTSLSEVRPDRCPGLCEAAIETPDGQGHRPRIRSASATRERAPGGRPVAKLLRAAIEHLVRVGCQNSGRTPEQAGLQATRAQHPHKPSVTSARCAAASGSIYAASGPIYKRTERPLVPIVACARRRDARGSCGRRVAARCGRGRMACSGRSSRRQTRFTHPTGRRCGPRARRGFWRGDPRAAVGL